MNPGAAALMERFRRDRLRATVRTALLAEFEITKDLKDKIRRTEAYVHAAGAAQVKPITNQFCRLVLAVVQDLGGIPVKRGGPAWFRCLRRRGAEPQIPRRMTARQVADLRRKWYARARQGFDDIETDGGQLKAGVSGWTRVQEPRGWWEVRKELNTAFFSSAAEHYWRLKQHLDVWGLYALEGLTVREIAARQKISRSEVGRIVKAMRTAMERGGHPDLVEETRHGTEEERPEDEAAR